MIDGISGSLQTELRGSMVEIIYRRTEADIEWWFASDHLNDMPLTARERQDLWREAMADSKRGF